MKLKYRVLELHCQYRPQYFEGFWVFGRWHTLGGYFDTYFDTYRAAEQAVMEYANTVLVSHGKVIRKITIKG